jgi:hypothetical protein
MPVLFTIRSREGWTEERILAGLELYLRRKRRFPTKAEFLADGVGSLHAAVNRTEGVQRWSAELSVPLGPGQQRGHHQP